ncbi:MAG: hypothetical protein EOP38_16335 [Rubrivivax sp.]|nr:MAG: hypothetical protein EOP38_16335 [Rubrivivax sp.]
MSLPRPDTASTLPLSNAPAFAHTKIKPPRQRAGQVARPALVSALRQAIGQHRLALLTAPAGFGKTAVLSQLLQQLPPATGWCWISADADDDLGRLITCLSTALDPWDLPWRVDPEAIAEQAQQGGQGLRLTAHEVAATLGGSDLAQGVIVIDDAHRIANPQVLEWLDALLEQLPAHWTLLISSRVEPPLALPRWRARGEVLDLRQHQLQFSSGEIESLLTTLGHGSSPERLQSLTQRTQGWAAGLSLLLRTDQPGDGQASARPVQDRHMFDFLASEVLDGLPADLRQFLLRCAVLPELTAARCAEVSGQDQAWRLLDDIERLGLFVTVLDDAELTLQLHDLFRDFLEDRLRKESPGEWPTLLQRAADTEPDPLRKMGFLIKAKAWADAEATLFKQSPELIAHGHAPQVLRLVEQFPAHWRDDSARLTHLHGQCAWAQWDLVTMTQALARAGNLYDAQGETECAQEARMLQVLGLAAGGQVLPSYALLAQLRTQPLLRRQAELIAWQASSWHAVAGGLYDQAAAPFGQMVDLLLEGASPMLWLQSVPLTSFLGLPGTRVPLKRYVDGALALCHGTQGDKPTPLSVMAHIFQAGLDLWSGELADAAHGLQTAREDCRWLNQPPNLMGYWSLVEGLTQAVLGNREAALIAVKTRLGSLDDERTSGRKATWLNHFYFFQVRVACILEDRDMLDEACALLQANPKPDEHRIFLRERATLPARLAARDQRWDEAAMLYQQALNDETGIDLYGQALETRLRLAHAQLLSGQHDAAVQSILQALARAAERGEIGGALFAGALVLRQLASHDWQLALNAEQQQTLQDWARRVGPATTAMPSTAPIQPPVQAIASPAKPNLQAQLSSRELDVLGYMSRGHSNKLIARELDLSPHTVKRHVANILDKLGVSSRGQAVASLMAAAP